MKEQEMAELLLRDIAQECQDAAQHAPIFEAVRLLDLSDQLADQALRIWETRWDEAMSRPPFPSFLRSTRFDA